MTEPLDLLVRSRRVVMASGEVPRAVGVVSGRIAAVEPYNSPIEATRRLNLDDDLVLLPGLVDSHVHVCEPGNTEWEGFETATRAAAAGGVTTLVDMPLDSMPVTVDVSALRAKERAAAGQCHVDVGFWGGAVPGNLGSLAPLIEAGVLGFKCFLVDSGLDAFPPLDALELEVALAELRGTGLPLLVHAEDGAVASAQQPAHGPRYADFLRSRPREVENRAVATLVAAARRTGGRAHVCHLSSSDALAMLASARQEGIRLTVETCPHYLSLAAEEVADGATAFKCCPPIREAANREALWAGLASGVIELVVSDHSPCTTEMKHLEDGDFGAAWGGVSSLQLSLPVVWTEARARGLDLSDVVRWMAKAPARLAGLAHKGQIARGFDADLVVFAPEEAFVVEASSLRHRNKVTPYEGRKLHGVVQATFLRGREVGDGDPTGRLLRRRAAQGRQSVA